MCLGVPMRIKEINGFNARCEARGIERNASLFLLQHEEVQVGDMVMIHVGHAIQKMSEEDAQTAWDLYDEMFAAEDEALAAEGRHPEDQVRHPGLDPGSPPAVAPTGKKAD